MKIITIKEHGILDYLVGALFLALPFLAGWETDASYSQVFFVLGALTLFYSLTTRYELGLFKVIPFNVHLMIDFISGVFLAASPWLLGFADEVYLPHVLLGFLEIVVVMLTRSSAANDTAFTGYNRDAENRH